MNLKDRLNEDMKAARRAKEMERLGTIRLLLAAMKQKEVDERVELDDAAVIAIVDKLIKQRKDSIAAFEGAGRQDLADKEKAEMAVLTAYLPARMSAEEVATAVKAIVAELKLSQGRMDLSRAVVTAIEPAGLGHRVCVDTISMLKRGQGMLVVGQHLEVDAQAAAKVDVFQFDLQTRFDLIDQV